MKIKEFVFKDIKFVFLYQSTFGDVVNTFSEFSDYILEKIVEKFGKLRPDKIYVIMDSFGISKALLYNHGVVLLNCYDGASKREIRQVIKIFIHELCHLTESGYYKGNKTPPELHESFDEFSESLVRELKF